MNNHNNYLDHETCFHTQLLLEQIMFQQFQQFRHETSMGYNLVRYRLQGKKNNKKITVNWLKKEKVAGAKVFMHSVVFVHHVFRT